MPKRPRAMRRRVHPLPIALVAATAVLGGLLLLGGAPSADLTAAQSGPTDGVEVLDALPTARPASIGAPRDPLSIDEIGYAQALAGPSLPEGATDAFGEPGAQVLGVELAIYDPAVDARIVDVSHYDYTSDQLVVTTIDIGAGAVVESVAAAEVQPPPAPDETSAAAELLVSSPEGEALLTEYLVTTGKPLVLDDLVVTGGSYLATAETDLDDACGVHRCIELQMKEPGGLYLTALDFVVDLSAGEVIVLDHDTPHGHGADSDHGN